MSLNTLEQQLQRTLAPVYLVTGDAAPLVDRATALIEQAALAKVGLPAFNHAAVRCTDAQPSGALVAARTPPMMGERRLVVIREIDQGKDDFYESLQGYLASPNPSTVLLLTGPRLPKQEKGRPAWSRSLKKALKAAKAVMLDFSQKDVNPESFARDVAAGLDKKLGREAARMLVETVGGELGRLRGEVQKLALYVGDAPEIEPAAVGEVCALLAEAEIWDLTAGLATGDRPLALQALYRLQEAGDEPRRTLSMIAWQARQLVQAAELARRGVADDRIRSAVRMRWDTFRRVRPRLEQGIPGADVLLRRLASANRNMNSHRAGAARILDELVLDMLAE